MALSFNPFPEKCTWSNVSAAIMYCVVPLAYTPPDYLDLWHQGVSSAADSIVTFNITTGDSVITAIPGTNNGGVESDIFEMSVSPDERYLSFTTKGARALWGVRLTQ